MSQNGRGMSMYICVIDPRTDEDLDGMDEFYDLAADPYELRNRIDDEYYADALTEMQAELDRLLEETR